MGIFGNLFGRRDSNEPTPPGIDIPPPAFASFSPSERERFNKGAATSRALAGLDEARNRFHRFSASDCQSMKGFMLALNPGETVVSGEVQFLVARPVRRDIERVEIEGLYRSREKGVHACRATARTFESGPWTQAIMPRQSGDPRIWEWALDKQVIHNAAILLGDLRSGDSTFKELKVKAEVHAVYAGLDEKGNLKGFWRTPHDDAKVRIELSSLWDAHKEFIPSIESIDDEIGTETKFRLELARRVANSFENASRIILVESILG